MKPRQFAGGGGDDLSQETNFGNLGVLWRYVVISICFKVHFKTKGNIVLDRNIHLDFLKNRSSSWQTSEVKKSVSLQKHICCCTTSRKLWGERLEDYAIFNHV